MRVPNQPKGTKKYPKETIYLGVGKIKHNKENPTSGLAETEKGKNKPNKKYKLMTICLVIIVFIAAAYVVYLFGKLNSVQKELSSLKVEHKWCTSRLATYKTLSSNYSLLQANYSLLQANCSSLQEHYLRLGMYTKQPPYTVIENGTVTWTFQLLNGNMLSWDMPIETYREYVSKEKNIKYVTLECRTCSPPGNWLFLDLRTFIQPTLFDTITSKLTFGRTDKQFVYETINLKSQLVTYGLANEFPKWPIETLTEGRGVCGDTSTLIGSLLVAGNNQAKYGMKIELVYLDLYNVTTPKKPNHAIVYIKFKDNSTLYLETAEGAYTWSIQVWDEWGSPRTWFNSNMIAYYNDSYKNVNGWRYDITNLGSPI
jgi:hypothetical protein